MRVEIQFVLAQLVKSPFAVLISRLGTGREKKQKRKSTVTETASVYIGLGTSAKWQEDISFIRGGRTPR
jgi:hypothetical protein